MKFSLINVLGNENGLWGSWIQGHVGTLETAIASAIATENANGSKIDVAVVEEVSSAVPIGMYFYNLRRLDKRRSGK